MLMIPTLQKKRHLKTPPSADSALNSGAQLHLQASEEAAEPLESCTQGPAVFFPQQPLCCWPPPPDVPGSLQHILGFAGK